MNAMRPSACHLGDADGDQDGCNDEQQSSLQAQIHLANSITFAIVSIECRHENASLQENLLPREEFL